LCIGPDSGGRHGTVINSHTSWIGAPVCAANSKSLEKSFSPRARKVDTRKTQTGRVPFPCPAADEIALQTKQEIDRRTDAIEKQDWAELDELVNSLTAKVRSPLRP